MNPLLTQPELLVFYAVGCRSYLEVGVQEGRSLAAVVRGARGKIATVTLCDDWDRTSGGSGRGSHAHIVAMLDAMPEFDSGVGVRFLDGDSRQTLPVEVGSYDLVHIDGGHSYDVAASDLQHGWRLCGRRMLVHDISFKDVWTALYEFLQTATGVVSVRCFFGGHGTAVLERRLA